MLKGWKTIVFNVAALVLLLLNSPELLDMFPGKEKVFALAVILINGVLRFLTDSPVGFKKK